MGLLGGRGTAGGPKRGNGAWGLESGTHRVGALNGFRGTASVSFVNTTVLAIGLFVQRRSYTNPLNGSGTANASLAGNSQHAFF